MRSRKFQSYIKVDGRIICQKIRYTTFLLGLCAKWKQYLKMLPVNGEQDTGQNIEKLIKYRSRLNLWNKKRKKGQIKIPNKYDFDIEIAAEGQKERNLPMLKSTN
jgi:hypothetical protein